MTIEHEIAANALNRAVYQLRKGSPITGYLKEQLDIAGLALKCIQCNEAEANKPSIVVPTTPTTDSQTDTDIL